MTFPGSIRLRLSSLTRPCIIGYVPPPKFPGAESFLRNIREWRPKNDLILFSEHLYGSDVIQIKGSPESIRGAKYPDGRSNPWVLQNWIFFTALRILRTKPEYTHLCWLESDCRVLGENWDEILFEHALCEHVIDGIPQPRPLVAGSVVCYQPCSKDMEFTKAWMNFITANAHKQFPIPCYGGVGAAEVQKPAIFTNGAISVYDIAWVSSHFDLSDPPPPVAPMRKLPSAYNLGGQGAARATAVEPVGTKKLAADCTAFDYKIGQLLLETFGVDLFTKIRHLDCSYSSYGNVLTSETERRQLLLDGNIVAGHQYKSDWLPTVTVAPRFIGGVAQRQTQRGEGSDSPANADSFGKSGSIPRPLNDITESEARGLLETAMDPDFVKVMGVKPRVDLFIVSHAPDFRWLSFCLRSIFKFAKGFGDVVVVIPKKDEKEYMMQGLPAVNLQTYEEPAPPLGHLGHLCVKCHAEAYSQGEYFCHLDSDCVFTEPVTPDSYFHKGKPVLLKRLYAKLEGEAKAQVWWQEQTERALGIPCPWLTMCRHPSIYHRDLYGEMRAWISIEHNCSFEDYVLKQKPTRLPGFSEFCALGAFALANNPNAYHWFDVTHTPYPHNPLKQYWSFDKWTPELEAELERIVS